jgi:uncharacterized protein YndB with AHSA1/START domain
MSSKLQIETPGEREIRFNRVFKAPRAVVFDCWTKPELVKRWLTGPDGWVLVLCEIDLRVGGAYRYVWRDQNGVEMGMHGVHTIVEPPLCLACTQAFDDNWTMGETVGTLEFNEQAGITTVTNTIVYASREARDFALSCGMDQGMESGYQRLDRVLATLA